MFFALCLILGVVASLGNAAVNPVSLDLPIPHNRSTVLPEVSSNNVTNGRSLFGFGPLPPVLQGFREATLPFVVKQLGLIECAGLDHSFGGNFFESIMGPGADFGGNYLCQPTCGGDCVPTQGLGEAPISIYYPFGCRCRRDRCNRDGPVISPLIQPIFKVVCARDEKCTCASMGPEGSQVGYICNWINLNTKLPVTFLDRPLLQGYHPTYSPIRWCSCCPRDVVG